jgi:hypothetical protein
VAVVLLFLGSPAVRAEPHDEAWTFADNGSLGYRLDAYNPVHLEIGLFVRENPTLPLEVGKRYQLSVANYTAYPLEVIAKGASVAQDRVLLSMGSNEGTFASDPEVNWQDLGQGVVQFTLTPRLYHAMMDAGGTPGYRCRTQAATMRGDFVVKSNPLLVQRAAFSPIAMN